jgi:hypothetical protein
VKKFTVIVTAVAALLLIVQAGGGFGSLINSFGDWLDGESASATLDSATQNSNSNAHYSVTPRAPGATLSLSASSVAQSTNPINNDPSAQLALWQSRFERANEIYENYRSQTKYPFDSRPAREHPDQMYPNRPVVEDRKLKNPGAKASQSIKLRTTQERVFVTGDESVLFTVAAFDANDTLLPISFTRAVVYDPPRENKPSRRNPSPFTLSDQATSGDITSGDLVYSRRLSPLQEGFATHSGLIRIELNLSVAGETGFLYFDVYYTPSAPAVWRGSVREALEKGSLNFYLPIDVRTAGRYVIAGRVDDAKGAPFALVTFNDEIAQGQTEIKLNLFGKLLVDEAPAFPLTLRDVDGFLLIPDADPDRALMQRLQGKQHVSRSYALTAFSDAEWDSEERRRYLEEYGKDVESARRHLEHIRRSMRP